MTLVRLATVAAVATAALLLSGCSAASSAVTVSYERDGVTHTETIHPDSVTCDAKETGGVSVGNDPVGAFSFGTPYSSGAGHVTATIVVDEGDDTSTYVYFEGEDAAPDRSTRGSVTVAESSGSVILIDDWDAKHASDFDRNDGTEVEATISAQIRCED